MAERNFEACLARVAAKGKIGTAGALSLLQQVADRAEKAQAKGEPDPLINAAAQVVDGLKTEAKQNRADAIRNAFLRKDALAAIEANGGIANAGTVIRGMLHDVNTPLKDMPANIQSKVRHYAAEWGSVMDAQLQKDGTGKLFASGQSDEVIGDRLYRASAGEDAALKENNPASKIAAVLHPLLLNIRDRLNNAGARIGNAMDYVIHMSHSPELLRQAAGSASDPIDQAFKAWWEFTEPRLADKTFDTVEPRDGESVGQARARFGRSVYETLLTGVHMTPDGAFGLKDENAFQPPTFEGSRNLARKLSQPRVLFFKDGASTIQYLKTFGQARSLAEAVVRNIDSSARNLALMERLGTNPRDAMFNPQYGLLRQIQEKYRGDPDAVARFQREIGETPLHASVQQVMDTLDGTANTPEGAQYVGITAAKFARVAQNLRTLEMTSSLGGVGLTHLASIFPTLSSEAVHHGEGRMATMGRAIYNLLTNQKSAPDKAELHAQMGSMFNGFNRDAWSRFGLDSTIPGRISAMANLFMKYTGIHYIFDNVQTGFKDQLANRLARNLDTEFGALHADQKPMLQKYGIGPDQWRLLQTATDFATDGEGNRYLTPRTAQSIDSAAVEAHLRATGRLPAQGELLPEVAARAVDAYKREIGSNLGGLYADAAAHGTITAGVREKSFLLRGARPGTIGGELARFFWQFKSWPVAAAYQVLGREFHMSANAGKAAWNLGILLGLSTIAGYGRMTVNDWATGRPPRSPGDWHTLLAAMAQGGGLGIFGDYLFGEVNRMGGSSLGALGGPVIGDMEQLWKIYNQWRTDMQAQKEHKGGKFSDIWPELARWGVRHVPFGNLIYLKGSLDYLLWYHLYEAASPGWWGRVNKRLLKEQGRSMLGYEPGKGIPWTLPGAWAQGVETSPQ